MGKLKIFAVLICMAFTFNANAQEPSIELLESIGRSIYMNELRTTSLAVDSVLIVRDDHLTATNTLLEEIGQTFFVRDFIIFEIIINDSTRIQAPFTALLGLNLTFLDSLGDTLSTVISLEVEYDTLESNQRLRAIYECESGYLISSQVLSLDIDYDWVIHSLILRNEIHTSRIMEFDCVEPIVDLSHTDDFIDHQELILNWQPIDGVKYDLEWTFIDKYSPDYILYGTFSDLQRENLFKNNCTRVTLDQNSYVIKLGYPEGYLLYRVRAIQIHDPYIIVTGPWTNHLSNYYTCDGLEIDKNWTFQASFAEEGKRNTLINYFDGIGRSRQLNSINESYLSGLISNNYYNIDGLKVITSLPAPYKFGEENGRQLYYFPNFNKDINNQEYNHQDVSTDVCSPGSAPMSTSSGAGKYYSNQSDFLDDYHRFTPDAEGFPFSESIYTNDNTGRVAIQGNAGDELAISGEHATKYFYAKASQEELYRVFGLDVGNEKYYNKEGVIDPNGQFSVTYKDGKDRIIASALGGEAPPSLVPLNYEDEYQENLTVSMIRSEFSLNNQVVSPNNIKMTYFFLVTSPGTYDFDYDIVENPIAMFEDCNLDDLCYHCKYDLSIVLSDECGDLHTVTKDNFNLNSWSSICGVTNENMAVPPFTYNFPKAGMYSITKTLTLNNDMREIYLQDYLSKASCKTYNDFLLEAIAEISFDDCDMTCEECLANVGTESEYLIEAYNEYTENGGDPEAWESSPEYDIAVSLYKELRSKCDDLCGELGNSICNQFMDQMKVDVSLGGQYFTFDEDPLTLIPSCPASPTIFSVVCPSVVNGEAPYEATDLLYVDEDGIPILVETDGGIMKKPNELTLAEFIQHFQSEWANTLVKKHPEYCLVDFCSKLTKTMKYDFELSEINSFQGAIDEGIIDQYGYFIDLATTPPSVYHDPIFIIGNGSSDFYSSSNDASALKNTIQGKLDNYAQTGFSALEYAMFLAKNQVDPVTLTVTPPGTPNSFSTLCEGEKNYVWEFLKSVYLEQKLIAYRAKRPTNCGSGLGCAVDGYFQNGFTSNGLVCGSPNSIGNGIPRFLLVTPYPYNNTLLQTGSAVTSTVGTQINDNKLDLCESYKSSWETILVKECGYTLGSSNLNSVLDNFVVICSTAVDPTHPMGASDNPNTQVPPLVYQTFQDVLDAFPPSSTPCNSLVITMPPAYNQIAVVSPIVYFNNSLSSIPACVCEALTDDVIPEFLLVLDPTGLTPYSASLKNELAEFMKRKYNSKLTADEIQNLIEVCNNSNCNLLSHPIYLPDVLSCKVCINCEDVRSAISAFETDPNLAALNTSLNKNSYLSTYLNREFGFNYFWQDYADFLKTCESCAPIDDCTDALAFYQLWVSNHDDEQDYPLALYLNINVGTHLTNAEWLQYFNESCNSLDISVELATPTDYPSCEMLEEAIINYINHKDIPNVTNFYPDIISLFHSQYWSYLDQGVFGGNFISCDFPNRLKLHNPDLCTSLQTMANLINSAQPPVIYASDSLAQSAFVNIFPDMTLTYARNILRFCGLYDPQVSCNDINNLYNDWLAMDLDEPIPFFEFANTQNEWNYTDESYSNWLRFCNSSQQCKLCYKELMVEDVANDDNCYDMLMSFAAANAQNAWETYLLALEETFNSLYTSTCINQLKEQFNMTFDPKEYHYTLYYYDRAGNLFKTIPPQGVKFLSNTEVQDLIENGTATTNYPLHEYVTWYKYNAYNKVIKQKTPDAGETTFWYDELGRIILSQSQQKSIPVTISGVDYTYYSYTLYDDLGRISEVGKMMLDVAQAPSCVANQCMYDSFKLLINSNTTLKTEVVRTFYDEQLLTSLSQDNLLKRVATTTYSDEYSLDPLIYNYATHYSYDLSGNVKTVYQENTNSVPGHQMKRIDYVFDLVSGKVNKVYYQHSTPEEINPDQFIHQYEYDADNLLKKVSTSMNDDLFVTDANYSYYLHGPLARTLLGERKVQGLDYAYTIQGWLKGVNSGARLAWKDMGRDGWIPPNDQYANPNREVGRDAFSFTLNYFENDYVPVGGMGWHPEIGYSLNDWITPFSGNLYNGNIRSMTNDIQNIDNSILGIAYKYDQLNRIKGTHTIFEPNLSIWKWDENSNENMAYEESGINYDKNGNIKIYTRKDETGSIMDDLEYFLDPNEINNQLNYVSDNIATIFDGDLESQNQNNYTYDDDGNLTSDTKENIDIIWNNFGKVDSIKEKNNRWALGFSYDPAGNRIEKRYFPDGDPDNIVITYYVRDAQGNVMATYKREISAEGEMYSLLDWSVYGSARLGLAQVFDNALWKSSNYGPPTWTEPLSNNKGTQRSYELTNHLGNVIAVVSDLKTFVDTIGSGQPNYWDYSIANLSTAQDYYPFGMLMPGRNNEAGGYRFAFNGKEKDDEVKGVGNSLDFGARIYDSRLGRWLSVDPLQMKYPSLSPYNFVSNNPLLLIDKDGREIFIYSSNVEQKPILYQPGMKEIGDKFQQQAIAALNYIHSSGSDTYKIVETFANDKSNIGIKEGNWKDRGSSITFKFDKDKPVTGSTPWSPEQGIVTNEGGRQSPANTLLHELGHYYFQEYDPMGMYAEMPDFYTDPAAYSKWESKWKDFAESKGYDNVEDYWIIENPENDYARKEGEGTRKAHSYKEVYRAKDIRSLEGSTETEIGDDK